MALPTQAPLYDRPYTAYVANLSSGTIASIAVAARGRVTDIRFVPLTSPTTNPTVFTPKVNATQMQLNGSNTTFSMAAAAPANAVGASLQPNGLNTVDLGDVINIASDGGAANAASVAGYFTLTVRQTSQ